MAHISLRRRTPEVDRALCLCLWSWQTCQQCPGEGTALENAACANPECAYARIPRLERYFQFYATRASDYATTPVAAGHVFETHGHVFEAVSKIRTNPGITRLEFETFLRARTGDANDLERAITFAVRVLTMLDCSGVRYISLRSESRSPVIPWKGSEAFSEYLGKLFPIQGNPTPAQQLDLRLAEGWETDLLAKHLVRRIGLRLVPAHDVRDHLRYHPVKNELEIFHHAAFLKEHLRATKDLDDGSNPACSISRGALPRQVAVEVLDSIQRLLFPRADDKSLELLEQLVVSLRFDQELLRSLDFRQTRRSDEESIHYVFLADRLAELHQEFLDPQPRRWLDRKIQRRSGQRHMMTATLAGVCIAILLGFASLAVSSYQTWLAYQAWKHPVPQADH